MTPEARAALHRRCFDRTPPPWSAAAFAAVLAQPTSFVFDAPDGFALGRAAAGEADLLTLAVAPEAQRRGIGRALVAGFEAAARARGARTAYLDVAASNAPARALYEALGYREAGRRPGYYAAPGGPAADAILMKKALPDRDENA